MLFAKRIAHAPRRFADPFQASLQCKHPHAVAQKPFATMIA